MVQIWLGNAGLWLGIFHGMNGWESLRTVHIPNLVMSTVCELEAMAQSK